MFQGEHFILPVGTAVVVLTETRDVTGKPLHAAGAIATIIKSPVAVGSAGAVGGRYRVRFYDGVEEMVDRRGLEVLSRYQLGEMVSGDEKGLWGCVIYRCVIGSRAYGLEDEDSDTDTRGIFLPPADAYWSLTGVPDVLENDATQEAYWEAKRFISLALRANPNVLECLYSPLVQASSPIAEALISIRGKLLSKLVYQTYSGYVASQFKKIQSDVRNQGAVKWKHAMHLLRLQLAGVHILKTGHVEVKVAEHRERLLAVKRGEIPFDECDRWRLQLSQRMEEAVTVSPLPDRPDYAAANQWLLQARRSSL